MAIFYHNSVHQGVNELSEEESKHCFQVLRLQKGDEIQVFDGNGGKHKSILTQTSKKTCAFEVIESIIEPKKNFHTHLAIAPTKSTDRMEWLIEKLSEIGVDEVTFIQTKHSERKKLRLDRLEKKAISAMKQSGNPFLLKLHELTPLDSFVSKCNTQVKLIAHVNDSHKYIGEVLSSNQSVSILIGPEGDFSDEEVSSIVNKGFQPVSLGINTLRTETAGFVACCMINLVNKY